MKRLVLSVAAFACLGVLGLKTNSANADRVQQQANALTGQISRNILKAYVTGHANTKKHPYLAMTPRMAKKQARYQSGVSKSRIKAIRATIPRHKNNSRGNWYSDGLNNADQKARARVVFLESSGRWNVTNGSCYGRFQLLPLYLGYVNGHVNLNRYHQVKTADSYVSNRYGNWQKALAFHLQHGYY